VKTPVPRTTLIAISTTALLFFAFGLIAEEVAGGEMSAFDRKILLAMRDPADPSLPLVRLGCRMPLATSPASAASSCWFSSRWRPSVICFWCGNTPRRG